MIASNGEAAEALIFTPSIKGQTLTFWGPKAMSNWRDHKNSKVEIYIFSLAKRNIKKQTWNRCEWKHYTSTGI